ncbi:hypothetical protein KUTeg_010866, partial [Tegillarca granosa]
MEDPSFKLKEQAQVIDASTMTDDIELDSIEKQPKLNENTENAENLKTKGKNSDSNLCKKETPTSNDMNSDTVEDVESKDTGNDNESSENKHRGDLNDKQGKIITVETPTYNVILEKDSGLSNTSETDEIKNGENVSYSENKENFAKDKSEPEVEKRNDQSGSWKGRLTRKRKPSAVVLEAQSEKGYTKITVTKDSDENDTDNSESTSKKSKTKRIKNTKTTKSIANRISEENLENTKSEGMKNTKERGEEELKNTKVATEKSVKQEMKDETFDIYVSGEKMFEGILEMNDDSKQKPVTDIKVEGTEETGFFVDFEKFDEKKIPKLKRKSEFSEHKLSTEPEVYERSSDGGYICNYCGKICNTKTWLRRHRRTHTNERPHKCEECGKTYRQYGHLLKHKISHNPEHRPHMCDICGKTFSYIDSLKSHKKLHLDLPPCQCQDCGRTFARVELLKQHLAFKKQGEETSVQRNTLRKEASSMTDDVANQQNEPSRKTTYIDDTINDQQRTVNIITKQSSDKKLNNDNDRRFDSELNQIDDIFESDADVEDSVENKNDRVLDQEIELDHETIQRKSNTLDNCDKENEDISSNDQINEKQIGSEDKDSENKKSLKLDYKSYNSPLKRIYKKFRPQFKRGETFDIFLSGKMLYKGVTEITQVLSNKDSEKNKENKDFKISSSKKSGHIVDFSQIKDSDITDIKLEPPPKPKKNFNVHVNNHLGIHEYTCDCCGIAFSCRGALRRHYKRKAGLFGKGKSRATTKTEVKIDSERGRKRRRGYGDKRFMEYGMKPLKYLS